MGLKGAAFVAWLVPGLALAGPGDHIRVGDATITPSIDIGVEHRTNPFRRAFNAVPGTNLRVSPMIAVEAKGRQATFALSGRYDLYKYFQPAATDLDRYTDFGISAKLDLLPESVVGFRIANSTGLQSRATEDRYETPYSMQIRNGLDGGLTLRAGPVLEGVVGGFWTYNDYLVPDPDQRGLKPFNSRNSAGPTLGVTWTFFPRTAVVFEGRYGWNIWDNNAVGTANPQSELGDYVVLPNSTFWKAQAGLRGRVTEKILIILMAGYGQSTYDETSVTDEACGSECDPQGAFAADLRGLDGLLITTQAKWEFGVGQALSVGYLRGFEDSWFSNYLTFDEVYAGADVRIGPMFGVHGRFGTRLEDYVGEVERKDIVLRAAGDISLQFRDWGAFRTGVAWDERASDPAHDDVEYDDVNIHGIFTFMY